MAQEAERSEHTVSTRAMEIVVSGLFVAAACLVMYDNWRIGARWAEDGPQAGYFPFYIGVIMFVASAVTLGTNLLAHAESRSNFVERSELVRVLQVFVPTVIYVLLIGFLGLYVSSAIFIAFFMAWLGKYPLYKIVPVAILIPVALFFMFEVWFLVPLPKGPLETALGY
jgi:putative tricarboxylic transport membrane protein